MISTDQITAIIAAIIALISAITAYLKNKETNTVIAALTPDTPQSRDPAVITTLPTRTWVMSDSTKRWLTFDAPDSVAQSILNQVANAEALHLVDYQITFPGGFYHINYGLLMGGAGNPSGK